MNLADILTLAGLSQQEPTNSLSTPGSSCNQHMNPDDMRTLVIKLERPQPEQEMVATEEAEYANAPDEREVGDTHDDFSFKGFGKRKRHTRDALGNYGDNPLEESKMFKMYKNFKLDEAPTDINAKYKELGLDQGDDPLGGWYDTMGMSDQEIAAAKQKRINDRLAQMARDEGGGGVVAGDIEKGQAINKAKRMAAADASLDKGTQTSDFGQRQIAKRDASWEKGIDNPPQQTTQVARQKPVTKPVKKIPKYADYNPALDTRPKKPDLTKHADFNPALDTRRTNSKRRQPVTGTTLPGTDPKQDAALTRLKTKYAPKIAAQSASTKKRVAMPPQLKRPTSGQVS